MLARTKLHKTQLGKQQHPLQYIRRGLSWDKGRRRKSCLNLRIERSCPLSLPAARPLSGQHGECTGKEEWRITPPDRGERTSILTPEYIWSSRNKRQPRRMPRKRQSKPMAMPRAVEIPQALQQRMERVDGTRQAQKSGGKRRRRRRTSAWWRPVPGSRWGRQRLLKLPSATSKEKEPNCSLRPQLLHKGQARQHQPWPPIQGGERKDTKYM